MTATRGHPVAFMRLLALAVAGAVVSAACSAGPSLPAVPVRATGVHTVYVAVGASDSLGFGTADPIRQAWPQRFFDAALPPGATFVNLAVAGSTVADAERQQLPYAAPLRPTVVTVFLGVNDLRAGVAPATFGSQLRSLLMDLRAGNEPGAGPSPTVLVANVPPLDRLPAYLACGPNPPAGAPSCSGAGAFPPLEELNTLVDAYDRQIADVAGATGSTLVDLRAAGLVARANGTEATTVSSDGFHPSAAGHRLIAAAFADAYRRATAAA